MIKDSQETRQIPLEPLQPVTKHTLPTVGLRPLRAIEIAEGALLADIGVIFQLLIKFLPVGGVVLQVMVPVLFAVIVLRRGFYVGCMSLCVALFVVCIVMGPGGAPFLLLESGAGIFLGLTMRYRLSHLLIFLIGVFGGGVALWGVLLFYVFVGGGAILLLRTFHQSYATFSTLLGIIFRWLHLGAFWQGWLFPLIDQFMQWGFQHWLFFYYLLSCFICIPLVIGVYFVVNFFLRLLGYGVRPFPGHLLEGWLLSLTSALLLFASWLLAGLSWLLTGLRRLTHPGKHVVPVRLSTLRYPRAEVRRLNIARLREHRLEKEARESL